MRSAAVYRSVDTCTLEAQDLSGLNAVLNSATLSLPPWHLIKAQPCTLEVQDLKTATDVLSDTSRSCCHPPCLATPPYFLDPIKKGAAVFLQFAREF